MYSDSDSSSMYYHGTDSDSEDFGFRSNRTPHQFRFDEQNSPLQNALSLRNVSEIESLLRSSATNIEIVDDYGNTPLIEALLGRFYSAVDLLVNKDVNVNAKNYKDRSPLHYAVLGGNEKYITLLIEKGADINSKDVEGKTPLGKAIESNSELAVKLLLEKGCNVNVLDNYGNSPLHIALKRKCWKIADILLANGCNVAQQNELGDTPLHIAVCNESRYDKGILDEEHSINMQVNNSSSVKASANDILSIWKLLMGNNREESTKIVNIKNNGGQTALHVAAKSYINFDVDNTYLSYATQQQGYTNVCDVLLSKGASVNDKDNDGNSPIHTAVEAANTALLKIILDSGADVNCLNKHGETALQIALKHSKNFEEKCRMLVGCGANVNVCDEYKQTPLHVAVKEDEGNFWQFLIDNGADVYARDMYGNSPLHLFAESGSCKYLHSILYNYPNVNHKNNRGQTALHVAAKSYISFDTDNTYLPYVAQQQGYAKFFDILLSKGASVNDKDNDGNSLIHTAVEAVNTDLLNIILDSGADVNCLNKRGETALQIALRYGKNCEEKCRMLVGCGANINVYDKFKQTPLHAAVRREEEENLWQFLVDNGADVYARNTHGNSPLHIIAESGSAGCLRDMLYNYPNVNHKNNKGKTALHIAATSFKDAEQKCELLIEEAGADVTVKDNFNRTPLHFAALNARHNVCELLIRKGAVVDAIDYYEEVPLTKAVKSRQLESMKYILENGADVNRKDRHGKTALHYSIGTFMESESMCRVILDRGADVNARDNDYQTPLHLATECLSLPVVRLLLEAGSEVNAQDKNGKTPLHMLDNRISDRSNMYLRDDPADTVKYMLQWGALSTLKDDAGNTALCYTLNNLPKLYWCRMKSVIIGHIVKCKSAKLYTDLECKLLNNKVKKGFDTSCFSELAALKSTMVGQHSLLDVFSQYSDPTYLSNCELKARLTSDEMLQFPIYGSLLKAMFKRAQGRVKLLYKAHDFLELPLPYEVNRKILSYLRDYDLHNLIKGQELCK